MNLTQCARGHYYDMQKYSACPYCSGDSLSQPPPNIPDKKPLPPDSFEPADPDESDFTMPAKPADGRGYGGEDGMTIPAKPSGGPGIIPDSEEEKPTEAHLSSLVVGWLVCTAGTNYGQSFTLHSGKNFIGRDPERNDVGVTGDNTISRVKHAVVTYEPRQRLFYVQSGENSHELVYLNGEGVFSNSKLKGRDVITVGMTSLVFVPFCDESFCWSNSDEEKGGKK